MSEHVDVLIVEDSPDDAELMARALRRSGFDPSVHRVDTAPALAAALAARSWHVILADYRMPAFSGHEALAMVQEAGVDIPFILVSGTLGEEMAVAMMKAGAHDFVLKHNLGRLGAAVGRELREAEVRRRRRWADTALEILAESARLSAEGLDVEAIVQRAAAVPVPRLADWCIVYARQWTALGHVRAVAATPAIDQDALVELADGYPPEREDHDPWLGVAQRARSPVLLGTVEDAELARITRDARHAQLLQRLAAHSLMVIPEIVGERVAGVLVLGARTPGRYGAADLAIASDVGGRVALVLENARLTREREEFISTAVHEIKTPIAVIKTAVQLVQQLSPEESCRRVPDLIARLMRQASRLDRLVTEVLEVSRLDLKRLTLVRRSTDLAALVERVVAEMRDISRDHALVIRRNDPITLEADPDRIEQVLANLVANAVKYSPAATEVEIESRRTAEEAVVSVRDHGIGIPRDKQPSIFERFFRAHVGTRYEHASSLGVGLYLSREFVNRHGGKIWFESEEGAGSTFAFSLPLTEAA
jgi:signal transduction histidine kinase